MKLKSIHTGFFILLFTAVFSQDSSEVIPIPQIQNVQSNSIRFEQAVESDNLLEQANSYYELAEAYYDESNFKQSEIYYQKAKNLFIELGKHKKAGKVSRKLAKTQEQQEKFSEAIQNYKYAADNSSDTVFNSLNSIDFDRLSNRNSTKEEDFIQKKISTQSKTNSNDEIAESYSQLADYNLRSNNPNDAITNYQNAYDISKEIEPQEALQYNQKINTILIDENKIDEAIALKKEVLNEDFVQNDSRAKAQETQLLAELFVRKNKNQEAIDLLKESYEISIKKGHTFEAQSSIKKLDSIYKSMGRSQEIVPLYKDFIKHLPQVIEKDNSLLNKKILDETIEKISQLEKEKALRDELIRRKNIFNYSLITSVLILSALLAVIFFASQKLRVRNKKIALQSLRREMNPHFIFNSLNSVNQFIAVNDELEANQYLTKYSKLMRTVMENSKDDFIPFSKEIDFIKNYLELEKKRFVNKFDYTLDIDESFKNVSNLKIPSMLIQPYVENAVWHGLRYLENKGSLQVRFKRMQKKIVIEIEDNGIGIEKSKEQKTMHQKQNKSRGMKNSEERIALLNDLYKKDIKTTVVEKQLPKSGVLVTIEFEA